jgi:hypothetical protein
MKIRIDLEGTAIMATLIDNETLRDFVALLPLTLTLEDDEEDYQGVIDLKRATQESRSWQAQM